VFGVFLHFMDIVDFHNTSLLFVSATIRRRRQCSQDSEICMVKNARSMPDCASTLWRLPQVLPACHPSAQQ
jgi:hypothetical protein